MTAAPVTIDSALVYQLLGRQFPQWASLPIRPVAKEGWCHRAFRLGDTMVVRLPRLGMYAEQVPKEREWLPRLRPGLPLPIPQALALRRPAAGYSWPWAVYDWIEGQPAMPGKIDNMAALTVDISRFLQSLQAIDAADGPAPGPHNFYRGGLLQTYDDETRQAIAALQGRIDTEAITRVWETALASRWSAAPVWIHGDVSVGTLLVRDGRLCAVIDFGNLAVGDPACDLVMNWTLFDSPHRAAFRSELPLDDDTWARGRGWALWKALIVAAGMMKSNAFEATRPWRIIEEVLADHELERH